MHSVQDLCIEQATANSADFDSTLRQVQTMVTNHAMLGLMKGKSFVFFSLVQYNQRGDVSHRSIFDDAVESL